MPYSDELTDARRRAIRRAVRQIDAWIARARRHIAQKKYRQAAADLVEAKKYKDLLPTSLPDIWVSGNVWIPFGPVFDLFYDLDMLVETIGNAVAVKLGGGQATSPFATIEQYLAHLIARLSVLLQELDTNLVNRPWGQDGAATLARMRRWIQRLLAELRRLLRRGRFDVNTLKGLRDLKQEFLVVNSGIFFSLWDAYELLYEMNYLLAFATRMLQHDQLSRRQIRVILSWLNSVERDKHRLLDLAEKSKRKKEGKRARRTGSKRAKRR